MNKPVTALQSIKSQSKMKVMVCFYEIFPENHYEFYLKNIQSFLYVSTTIVEWLENIVNYVSTSVTNRTHIHSLYQSLRVLTSVGRQQSNRNQFYSFSVILM